MNDYTKFLLGGFLVILLVSIGCWFWHEWQLESYRVSAIDTREMLKDHHARRVSPSEHLTLASVSTEDSHQSLESLEHDTVSPVDEVSALKSDIQETVEVIAPMLPSTEEAVSPFGLGVYPQIPASWPQDIQFFPAQTIEHELMLRVEIALTDQGIDVLGSTLENGRVYPNVAGTVYVRWTEDPRFGRYISEVGGHPETAMQFEMLLESFEEQSDRNFRVSDAPADIEVVDYDDSGIDPYSFLGL